jgi:cyclic pyranopterin phosphate synthase
MTVSISRILARFASGIGQFGLGNAGNWLYFFSVHIVNYMRISVTDRCNERCLYCQPHGTVDALPRNEILDYEEILRLVRIAVPLGVTKYRVTGGEPLVRHGVVDFIGELGKIRGVEDIGLSTNAVKLAPVAEILRKHGVTKVNISLDTLNPNLYALITGGGRLQDVLAGIDAAIAAGFPQVKLNMVLMKHKNDGEIWPMIDFARRKKVAIRFIELMPLSTTDVLTDENFISIGHVKRMIEARRPLVPEPNYKGNGPAVYYTFADEADVKIGFIGAMTNLHFCETCNKVRLTPDGKIRPCLGHHLEFDIKTPMRAGATDDELREHFLNVFRNKPEQHEFRENYQPGRQMVAIGG